jgi:hypothetical protein
MNLPHDLTQTFRPTSPRKSMEQRIGLPPQPAAGEPDVERRHRPVARLVSAALEPVWYWLDLYGPDDHPSNTKVMATAAILTGLLLLLVLGLGFVRKGTTPDVEYYGFAAFIIAGAAAWDAQKTRTKTRAAVDVIRSGAALPADRTDSVPEVTP